MSAHAASGQGPPPISCRQREVGAQCVNPPFGSSQPRPRVSDRLTNGTFFLDNVGAVSHFFGRACELANGQTLTLLLTHGGGIDSMQRKETHALLHCSQVSAEQLRVLQHSTYCCPSSCETTSHILRTTTKSSPKLSCSFNLPSSLDI
jgi:hypothetical protein